MDHNNEIVRVLNFYQDGYMLLGYIKNWQKLENSFLFIFCILMVYDKIYHAVVINLGFVLLPILLISWFKYGWYYFLLWMWLEVSCNFETESSGFCFGKSVKHLRRINFLSVSFSTLINAKSLSLSCLSVDRRCVIINFNLLNDLSQLAIDTAIVKIN